jgi:hypothetical protein
MATNLRFGHAARALALAAVAVLVVAPGCGSNKPSYCADRSQLETSVKDLGNVNIPGEGLNALESQLREVEKSANALVASAKSDFPSETSAISSSLSSLTSAIDALPSAPSVQQLAGLVPKVQDVANSVAVFADATSEKCG